MITVTELDTALFDTDVSFVSLGRLDQDIIDFIAAHRPDIANSLSTEKDILFWKDRIAHVERHRKDFITTAEYDYCFRHIPQILHNPDYISVHPKNNSISFIKDLSSHVSIAIRIAPGGKLSFRTMYPLMDAQLSHYIDLGHAWKYIKKI